MNFELGEINMKRKLFIWLIEICFNIKIDAKKNIKKEILKNFLKKKEIQHIILYVLFGELVYGGLCVFLVHMIKKMFQKLKVKKM